MATRRSSSLATTMDTWITSPLMGGSRLASACLAVGEGVDGRGRRCDLYPLGPIPVELRQLAPRPFCSFCLLLRRWCILWGSRVFCRSHAFRRYMLYEIFSGIPLTCLPLPLVGRLFGDTEPLLKQDRSSQTDINGTCFCVAEGCADVPHCSFPRRRVGLTIDAENAA